MPSPEESARFDVMREQMRELREQGLSYAEIGRRLNVPASAVSHRIRDMGGRRHGGHGRPAGVIDHNEAQTAEMWAAWVRGLSHRQLAEHYNLSTSTVGLRLRKYREALPQTEREMFFAREMALLDDLRREELAIFYNRNLDESTRLAAADRVMKGMERLAKMMGLDAAQELAVDSTIRYEIVSVDPTCHV